MIAYSYFPIRCMSIVEILVAIVGFLYAVPVFGARLLGGIPVHGWTPLTSVILMLGGLQLPTTGVIGEFLWRVLAQVRGREPYIIEHVYRGETDATTSDHGQTTTRLRS